MFAINEICLLAFTWGYQEILIVAVIGLLLFGSARLPSLMRNMGRSINEFKAGMKDKPNEHLEKDDSETEETEEAEKMSEKIS